MKTIYIISSEPYSGKGWLSLMLGLDFIERGYKISYFRPLGTLPVKVGDIISDEDAVYMNEELKLGVDNKFLCPVMMSEEFIYNALKEMNEKKSNVKKYVDKILESYHKISKNKDFVFVGGAGSLFNTGTFFGLSTSRIAELLDADVLLVTKFNCIYMLDSILASKELLGNRIIGVVINSIPQEKMEFVQNEVSKFLKSRNIEVIGTIPYDKILSSVSVEEVCRNLGGEIICGKDGIDNLIENFCVGAMNMEAALKYFRQIPNKAVITGGDRSDIQLSALETPTVCLILTGNLYPASSIIGKADSMGVPIIIVREDTLKVVDKIDAFLSRIPVRGKKKIEQAKKIFKSNFNLEKFYKLLKIK